MSWDCPYLKNNICELNNIECKPALGNCILKDKVVPAKNIKRKINVPNKSEKKVDKKNEN